MGIAYNVYVRFIDASRERGWSQILVDSAGSMQRAIGIAKSINHTVLCGDKILAITVNENGEAYCKNEITMMLGKLVHDELRLVCDDYCDGTPDWLPPSPESKTNYFTWWNQASPVMLAQGIFTYSGKPRMLVSNHRLLNCEISRDALGYVLNRLNNDDDYYVSSMRLLDKQIKTLSGVGQFDAKLIPPDQGTQKSYLRELRNDCLRMSHYDCREVVRGMLFIAEQAPAFFVGENVGNQLVRIIKSHVTMCMSIEDEIMKAAS